MIIKQGRMKVIAQQLTSGSTALFRRNRYQTGKKIVFLLSSTLTDAFHGRQINDEIADSSIFLSKHILTFLYVVVFQPSSTLFRFRDYQPPNKLKHRMSRIGYT